MVIQSTRAVRRSYCSRVPRRLDHSRRTSIRVHVPYHVACTRAVRSVISTRAHKHTRWTDRQIDERQILFVFIYSIEAERVCLRQTHAYSQPPIHPDTQTRKGLRHANDSQRFALTYARTRTVTLNRACRRTDQYILVSTHMRRHPRP